MELSEIGSGGMIRVGAQGEGEGEAARLFKK
jgi:hypothetical protein